jgi:methionyl aminopeptidase
VLHLLYVSGRRRLAAGRYTPGRRRECLEAGISEVGPGKRFGDVGAAIQELAEYHGYGVVRELGGHGVGHKLHEEPHINHFGRRGHGMRFREGMTLTIEPMINEGTPEIR